MRKHGKAEEKIIRQAQKRGSKLPEFILNAPELYNFEMLYFNAYIFLDTARASSFGGAGPIPGPEIVRYAERIELYGEELDEFVDILMLVDALVLKDQAEETE